LRLRLFRCCRLSPAVGLPRGRFSQIYQRYVGSSAGAAKGISLNSIKTVRSYFTFGLASLIIEDRAAAAIRGEPPVLDGDPFIGSQDWDISNLAIEVKDTARSRRSAPSRS
jgi:hypothetical protein